MFNYFSEKEMAKQKRFSVARDRFFKPLVSLLGKFGVSPNFLSFFGLFICSWVLFTNSWLFSALFLMLYILIDGLDGALARYQNVASNSGAIVDIFCDQMGVLFVSAAFLIRDFSDLNSVAILFYSVGYMIMIVLVTFRNKIMSPPKILIRTKYFFYLIYIYCLCYEFDVKINVLIIIFALITWVTTLLQLFALVSYFKDK